MTLAPLRLERQAQEEEPSATSVSSEVAHYQLDSRNELRRLNELRQNRPHDFEIYMSELKRDNLEIARRLERDLRRMQRGVGVWVAAVLGAAAIIGVIYTIYSRMIG